MHIQRFCQKAIVLKGLKILLLRYSSSNSDKMVQGKFGLPGGQLEFGEHPDESMIREIQEETGIIAKPGIPIYVWNWSYQKAADTIQINAIARLCRYESGELSQKVMGEESLLEDSGWYEINQLMNMELIPDQIPAIRTFLQYQDFFDSTI